jgi:hypothetical protein
LADINEGRMRTETARKEQLETWWQHMEEQFEAMRDQFEAVPTRLSNMGGHNECHHQPPPHVSEEEDEHDNEYKSGIPSVERGMQGRQPLAQAHATRWENGFKLDIPEFQGCLQPEEFLVTEKKKKKKKKKKKSTKRMCLVTPGRTKIVLTAYIRSRS